MKKGRFLMTILLLLIFCTACEAKDPENLFEMTPTETQLHTTPATEQEKESQPEIAPQIDFQEEVSLSVPYQYGNMQINIPPGNFMDYGDKILISQQNADMGQFLLYAMDKETLEVSLLCRDATCSHISAKCPSANKTGNLEQYDGRIFVLSSPVGGKIMELMDGQFETVADGGISSFWHANGNLYARTMDGSLVVYENGSNAPRILIEEFTMNRCVAFGRYLYGADRADQGVARVDILADEPKAEIIVHDAFFITDGTYIYARDNQTSLLSRYNMDGGGHFPMSDYPVISVNFDDDYIYFRFFFDQDFAGERSNEIYRMSKEDPAQIERIAELPEPAFQIFTVPGYDKIFVTNWRGDEPREEDREESRIYVVAKDGGSVEVLEFPVY